MPTLLPAPPRPTALDPRLPAPLRQLRGAIYRYVVIEALLVAGLVLVGWFAVGLVADFALFKLTTWDWVTDSPWVLRLLGLLVAGGLVAWAVVYRPLVRLTRDFSYPSLAQVLERRFPDRLQDRLITAVELADVREAERLGYSPDMLRRTIQQAADEVARLPLADVFNWRRLRVMGVVLGGLGAAMLAGGFAAHAVSRSASPYQFAWAGWHTATTLFDRQVKLANVPWPRRAHLEFPGLPYAGVKIPTNSTLEVRARAVRWVIADAAAPLGWRAMTWADLTPAMTGEPVKDIPPAAVEGTKLAGVPPADWLMDDVEEYGRDSRTVVKAVAALADYAARPGSARQVRRLEMPGDVTYRYAGGGRLSGVGTLNPQANREYTGRVTGQKGEGLKESVRLVVAAEDYRSPRLPVTAVDPPVLTSLVRAEWQPAYLHYNRPFGQGFEALRGKRQRMRDQDMPLVGERSLGRVPAGTEVVLTGTSSKPLRAAFVLPLVGRLPGANGANPIPVPVADDGVTVTLALRGDDRLTGRVEFKLRLEDTDGVAGERLVELLLPDEQLPAVSLGADGLRKVGTEFWVTPVARVVFVPGSGARAEVGLSKVEYTADWYLQATDAKVAGSPLAAKTTATFQVQRFTTDQNALPSETADAIGRKLPDPLDPAARKPEVITAVTLTDPARDYFDLQAAFTGDTALTPRAGGVQLRYRIDLNVKATDTNVDTGPKASDPKVNPLPLLVVSEADLLFQMGKDELGLEKGVQVAIDKLTTAANKLQVVADLGATRAAAEQPTARIQAGDTRLVVEAGRNQVREVAAAYRRIARESIFNRLNEAAVSRYAKLAFRLDRLLGEDPKPMVDGVSASPPRPTHTDIPRPAGHFGLVDAALDAVQKPLSAGQWADAALTKSADDEIKKLVEELVALKAELGQDLTREKLQDDLKAVIALRKRVGEELRLWERFARQELKSPNPTVRPVGDVFLVKGEVKRVRHGLNWNDFKGDGFAIKVASSDPAAVVVPPLVKVTFEDNDVAFEYEMRAGNTAGDFTITLTPDVGNPVTVKVKVK